MENVTRSQKKELSEYSRDLINDTRDILENIISAKEINDEEKLDDISVIRELARTCVVAILKDLNQEERDNFKKNPGGLKGVLQLSVEKAQLTKQCEDEIRKRIESITIEDEIEQSSIIDKLDLLDIESDSCKMAEVLYESFKDNSDVVQAHAYMNLTER